MFRNFLTWQIIIFDLPFRKHFLSTLFSKHIKRFFLPTKKNCQLANFKIRLSVRQQQLAAEQRQLMEETNRKKGDGRGPVGEAPKILDHKMGPKTQVLRRFTTSLMGVKYFQFPIYLCHLYG